MRGVVGGRTGAAVGSPGKALGRDDGDGAVGRGAGRGVGEGTGAAVGSPGKALGRDVGDGAGRFVGSRVGVGVGSGVGSDVGAYDGRKPCSLQVMAIFWPVAQWLPTAQA